MSEETQARTYKLDFNWRDWSMKYEQLAFREQVGVNPAFAMKRLGDAFKAADSEMETILAAFRAEHGPDAEMNDADLPEDYFPEALMDIDPRYLVGFVWIAERRENTSLSFDDLLAEVDYETLVMAVLDTITASVAEESEEADEAPLVAESGANGTNASPIPTTPSPSAPPSVGPSSTSKGSPRRASTKP